MGSLLLLSVMSSSTQVDTNQSVDMTIHHEATNTLEISTDADMVSLVLKGLGLVEVRRTRNGTSLYASVEVFGTGVVEFLGCENEQAVANTPEPPAYSPYEGLTPQSHTQIEDCGSPDLIGSPSYSPPYDSLSPRLLGSTGTQLDFDDEIMEETQIEEEEIFEHEEYVPSQEETIYMTSDDETVDESPPITLRRRPNRSYSSKFPGVTWKKANHKWMAQIMWEGKHINLGYFDDENEAAFMYGCFALARNPMEYYVEWDDIIIM